MIIKVCGLKDVDNANAIAVLPVDILGFIFYEKSPRFAGGMTGQPAPDKHKAGVFVNSPKEYVLEQVKKYGFDHVQLHGNESPEDCLYYKGLGLKVIKAFGIAAAADFEQCKLYEGCCDLYVFDTKTVLYGGSGRSFNHSLLSSYHGDTPFLLSGGISLEALDDIKQVQHERLAGYDLNSRFETAPGIKDCTAVAKFISGITTQQS